MADEWIECSLADACNAIDYGLTASAVETEVGPRFLRITDIVSGHIDWKVVPHVGADDETTVKYRLHDGDIVLARTGASTGASAYIRNPPLAVFGSYLVRLKAKPEFDARYLAYYLKSDLFWSFIRGVLGDKSAQPNASASTMTRAPLRAPRARNEQCAIGAVLGVLDDKIELNRRMNETLEAIARAIFKSWFVDFDPVRAKAEGRQPYGMDAATAALFPDSFVDSPFGKIPKGWGAGALREIAEITSGKRPAVRNDTCTVEYAVPLYGGGGVMGYTDSALFARSIVLTGRVGTIGLIFRICQPSWPSDNTLVAIPRRPEDLEFLFFQMLGLNLVLLNRGSTQPLITQTDLGNQPIVVPKPPVLNVFHRLIAPLFELSDLQRSESDTLAAIREALLPKLMFGEIRVRDPGKLVGSHL